MMYFCEFVYCTSESVLYFVKKFDLLRKDDLHKTYAEYFAEVLYGPLRCFFLVEPSKSFFSIRSFKSLR